METKHPFVPVGFEPPLRLMRDAFSLEPLGPQHNEADYAAWSLSIPHIRATPGYAEGAWPCEMSLADNLRDLESHANDFQDRRGFTYTVLDPADAGVIGCVYIYPCRAGALNVAHDSELGGVELCGDRGEASVRSWVRADRAGLDAPLWQAVSEWLREEWPFEHVAYAPRR